MWFQKARTLLIFFLCSSSSSLDILSVYFLSKTDLQYRRQPDIIPVSVRGLTDCAILCVRRNGCVSFFFNPADSLCQVEGRIKLTFNDSDSGSWTYYEMRMENVAVFKPVNMSSEHNPPYHLAQYAVDNRVVKIGFAEQCSSTTPQLRPRITIDLQNNYNVTYVTLFNRLDELGERLVDVMISIGLASGIWENCGSYAGPAETAEVVHVMCERPLQGRYVRIMIDNSLPDSILTLCEIKVLVSEISD